jgi:hypothetical protein
MTTKEIPTTSPPSKSIRDIKTLKDARRLLSKLISEFRRGELTSPEARVLTYMLTSYVSIYNQSDLEERLQKLEDSVK